MGVKRSHGDYDAEDQEQGFPKSSLVDKTGHSAKKQKFNNKTKHKAKEGSIEYAKKRARTIERTLNRNQDMPTDVRENLTRELEAHRETIGDKSFQKKRSAMISKYHMVRFFGKSILSHLSKSRI